MKNLIILCSIFGFLSVKGQDTLYDLIPHVDTIVFVDGKERVFEPYLFETEVIKQINDEVSLKLRYPSTTYETDTPKIVVLLKIPICWEGFEQYRQKIPDSLVVDAFRRLAYIKDLPVQKVDKLEEKLFPRRIRKDHERLIMKYDSEEKAFIFEVRDPYSSSPEKQKSTTWLGIYALVGTILLIIIKKKKFRWYFLSSIIIAIIFFNVQFVFGMGNWWLVLTQVIVCAGIIVGGHILYHGFFIIDDFMNNQDNTKIIGGVILIIIVLGSIIFAMFRWGTGNHSPIDDAFGVMRETGEIIENIINSEPQ